MISEKSSSSLVWIYFLEACFLLFIRMFPVFKFIDYGGNGV